MKNMNLENVIKNIVEQKKYDISPVDLEKLIAGVNQIIEDESQYADFSLKPDTKAEIKSKLHILFDEYNVPYLEEVYEEIKKPTNPKSVSPKSYWFVGASYNAANEDQTERFLENGIWENGYENKYQDLVLGMQPGDRIAIKASYVRKYELPFDNKGHFVSVMAIKVIGTITKNRGDGRIVEVNWESRFNPVKEWYFYTNRNTIWRVIPSDWYAEGLINFTFNNNIQDIDRFRNDAYWKERFGDSLETQERFNWTRFYEAVADKLIGFKFRRSELVRFMLEVSEKYDLSYLKGKEMNDMCPFTFFGLFNRGMTGSSRKALAKEIADFLDITESLPEDFDGIPVLNNQKSWFFAFEPDRAPDDVNSLWNFFEVALKFADEPSEEILESFKKTYDKVTGQLIIGWNITMALYWIRPWSFVTLDTRSQTYIKTKLGLEIGKNGHKHRSSATDYLKILSELELRFKDDSFPVHSFPELSFEAWLYKPPVDDPAVSVDPAVGEEDDLDIANESEPKPAPLVAYALDDIISEGAFYSKQYLSNILTNLKRKKNVILQGPPGTGKTWLAKKLAYALMGQKDESKLRAVQFHTNFTYEDFVRGFRPTGDGKLSLEDGPLLRMIEEAKENASGIYVMVIEEINRGNPAQIFGEMLTLLEADKRTPNEKLQLIYKRKGESGIYIPNNIYIIGTMNVADRSLAIVDFALRRRFAFMDLEPTFGQIWKTWVNEKSGISLEFLSEIETRIMKLNKEIEEDANLGAQFKIGHSYLTTKELIDDEVKWFKDIVNTEVGPLLDEYWFDDRDHAKRCKNELVEGL